ncbi:hypothetical protein [Paenibacillus tyrfis]|uniref:Uncharacterized protein n=1 Tax=Paenibacillus tyrfis TaxID=1501230 RepID=A0A081NV62_9BACL|nr:hypothetical protein [Paenibacillus tyrfis]KEQ22335.1 hypothetical protein ET33_26585 [Paenibacillus tyrfis]
MPNKFTETTYALNTCDHSSDLLVYFEAIVMEIQNGAAIKDYQVCDGSLVVTLQSDDVAS